MHDGLDEGDSTLHLLCHGSSRDASKMRQYLGTFFKEHSEFLLQIASDILSHKKQPIDDHINYILAESQPLDEIGICCFARMYHLHIAIIMDTMFWTTRWDHDINKCDQILGFKGGLQFVSMKWKTKTDNADKPTSEAELDPQTSDIDTT